MPTLIPSQVSVPFGRLEIVCEEGSAVTLDDAPKIFPVTADLFRRKADPIETANEVCDTLREGCELQGSHEHLFLLLYFNQVVEQLKMGSTLHNTLLPLPKARFSRAGEWKSVAADFAFWTGSRFVAVFIHESGFHQHWAGKEGLLKLWGFEVFCLMADEFETQGLTCETGLSILDALWLS